MYTFVKTHQNVHIKYVNMIVSNYTVVKLILKKYYDFILFRWETLDKWLMPGVGRVQASMADGHVGRAACDPRASHIL